MRVTIRRGSLVALALVITVFGLTGCSDDDSELDLSAASIQQMSCDQVEEALEVTEHLNDDLSPSRRTRLERELGIDGGVDIGVAIQRLEEQSTNVCPAGTAEDDDQPATTTGSAPTVTATDIPSKETSAPATEKDDDAEDTSATASISKEPTFRNWNEVVVASYERPELKRWIEEYSSEIDFDWSDVENWAVASTPTGEKPDARFVLAGQDKTESKQELRSSTGVGKVTSVLRVNFCGDVAGDGCPEGDEMTVLLAPLVLNKDGEVENLLRPGIGFNPDTGDLLVYTVQDW